MMIWLKRPPASKEMFPFTVPQLLILLPLSYWSTTAATDHEPTRDVCCAAARPGNTANAKAPARLVRLCRFIVVSPCDRPTDMLRADYVYGSGGRESSS